MSCVTVYSQSMHGLLMFCASVNGNYGIFLAILLCSWMTGTPQIPWQTRGNVGWVRQTPMWMETDVGGLRGDGKVIGFLQK